MKTLFYFSENSFVCFENFYELSTARLALFEIFMFEVQEKCFKVNYMRIFSIVFFYFYFMTENFIKNKYCFY